MTEVPTSPAAGGLAELDTPARAANNPYCGSGAAVRSAWPPPAAAAQDATPRTAGDWASVAGGSVVGCAASVTPLSPGMVSITNDAATSRRLSVGVATPTAPGNTPRVDVVTAAASALSAPATATVGVEGAAAVDTPAGSGSDAKPDIEALRGAPLVQWAVPPPRPSAPGQSPGGSVAQTLGASLSLPAECGGSALPLLSPGFAPYGCPCCPPAGATHSTPRVAGRLGFSRPPPLAASCSHSLPHGGLPPAGPASLSPGLVMHRRLGTGSSCGHPAATHAGRTPLGSGPAGSRSVVLGSTGLAAPPGHRRGASYSHSPYATAARSPGACGCGACSATGSAGGAPFWLRCEASFAAAVHDRSACNSGPARPVRRWAPSFDLGGGDADGHVSPPASAPGGSVPASPHSTTECGSRASRGSRTPGRCGLSRRRSSDAELPAGASVSVAGMSPDAGSIFSQSPACYSLSGRPRRGAGHNSAASTAHSDERRAEAPPPPLPVLPARRAILLCTSPESVAAAESCSPVHRTATAGARGSPMRARTSCRRSPVHDAAGRAPPRGFSAALARLTDSDSGSGSDAEAGGEPCNALRHRPDTLDSSVIDHYASAADQLRPPPQDFRSPGHDHATPVGELDAGLADGILRPAEPSRPVSTPEFLPTGARHCGQQAPQWIGCAAAAPPVYPQRGCCAPDEYTPPPMLAASALPSYAAAACGGRPLFAPLTPASQQTPPAHRAMPPTVSSTGSSPGHLTSAPPQQPLQCVAGHAGQPVGPLPAGGAAEADDDGADPSQRRRRVTVFLGQLPHWWRDADVSAMFAAAGADVPQRVCVQRPREPAGGRADGGGRVAYIGFACFSSLGSAEDAVALLAARPDLRQHEHVAASGARRTLHVSVELSKRDKQRAAKLRAAAVAVGDGPVEPLC